VQLVPAVAEHELRFDVDERLRRQLLMWTVLRLFIVVVQLAVGPRSIGGDEGEQSVPDEAQVDVIARRRVTPEPDGALEAPLAETRLHMVANILDGETHAVDGLEQVRGEFLVRGERRPIRRGFGARLAGTGRDGHRQLPDRRISGSPARGA